MIGTILRFFILDAKNLFDPTANCLYRVYKNTNGRDVPKNLADRLNDFCASRIITAPNFFLTFKAINGIANTNCCSSDDSANDRDRR